MGSHSDQLHEVETAMKPKGQLRVWWIPQVPGKSFTVDVVNILEAKLLLKALADYDIFQFENRIKPDYCNAGGLKTWDGKEWEDWYDEDGNDIYETQPAWRRQES